VQRRALRGRAPLVATGFACLALGVISSPVVAVADPGAGSPAVSHEQLAGPCCSLPAVDPLLVEAGWTDRPVRHTEANATAELVVTLDQQLYPALRPVIQRFAAQHGVKVAVENGTCGTSAGALYRKEVDVGGFCCPPGAADRLPGLRYRNLGIAAIALIVHPSNPLVTISLADARRIFMGGVQQWRDLLPGNTVFSQPIQPVTRLHCVHRPGHWRLLLRDADLFGPRVIDVGAISDMVGYVARSPAAIGYETVWMAERYRDVGAVKVLLLDGVSPRDAEAVAAGRYPLYRTFHVTTWAGAAANPLADQLVQVMREGFEAAPAEFAFVPRRVMAEYGWRFEQDELQGELAH